jgi:hypothetical protein
MVAAHRKIYFHLALRSFQKEEKAQLHDIPQFGRTSLRPFIKSPKDSNILK